MVKLNKNAKTVSLGAANGGIVAVGLVELTVDLKEGQARGVRGALGGEKGLGWNFVEGSKSPKNSFSQRFNAFL